jgi:hypothetical protein
MHRDCFVARLRSLLAMSRGGWILEERAPGSLEQAAPVYLEIANFSTCRFSW